MFFAAKWERIASCDDVMTCIFVLTVGLSDVAMVLEK